MERPAAYILDLDGVVYHGKTLIPGADGAISRMRETGSKVIFLTNNATRTRESTAAKLRSMGIQCSAYDVVSSAFAAAVHIKDSYGCCKIYPIGEEGLVEELSGAGHTIADHDVDIVVVGLDRQFTYYKLKTGLDNLMNGSSFIATNTDALLPAENGFLPGAGSIVAALKTASGIEPFTIGKPHRPIMEVLLKEHGLKSKDCIMIGDRLETDILGGIRAGMKTILVLTGASGAADIELSGIRPDTTIESIADLK